MNTVQNQSILTTLRNDTTEVNYEKGRERLGESELGQDAFFQLLLTQLQYQDPLNPTDNTEFIGQQAQFTQIEKLDKLIASIDNSSLISQSGSLVGNTVEIQLESGETTIGTIDSVKIGDGSLGIQIGEDTYGSEQIIQVFSNSQQNTP